MDGTDWDGKHPVNFFHYMDITCFHTKEVHSHHLPFLCTDYPTIFARYLHLDCANVASKPQRVPDHGAPDRFKQGDYLEKWI